MTSSSSPAVPSKARAPGVRSPGQLLRLKPNTLGRDFVVGDVVGELQDLLAGLRSKQFDPRADRLFCVGHVTPQLPSQAADVAAFLALPWVIAVRGDREDILITLTGPGFDHVVHGDLPKRNLLRTVKIDWFVDLAPPERATLLRLYREMPLAVEVAWPGESRASSGYVHAGVPDGFGWATFCAQLLAGDAYCADMALHRVDLGSHSAVSGVELVYIGHTLGAAPRTAGSHAGNTVRVSGLLQVPPAAAGFPRLRASQPASGAPRLAHQRLGLAARGRSLLHTLLQPRPKGGARFGATI